MTDLRKSIKDYLRGRGEVGGGEVLQQFARGRQMPASSVILTLFSMETDGTIEAHQYDGRVTYSLSG